jgi:very-short-patch-repair endonuclease
VLGRVDFAYGDERIVIEVDGRLFHGPEVFESDRERDNAAGLAGWRVLRFTWKMVTERPEYVVATVTEALEQAGRRVA